MSSTKKHSRQTENSENEDLSRLGDSGIVRQLDSSIINEGVTSAGCNRNGNFSLIDTDLNKTDATNRKNSVPSGSKKHKNKSFEERSLKIKTYDEKEHLESLHIEHIDEMPGEQFRKILHFLRVWELGACRLVSRRWNSEIVHNTKYAQSSVILLHHERVAACKDIHQHLQSFDSSFKSLRMLRVLHSQINNSMPPTFAKSMKVLELIHCGPLTWKEFLDLLMACSSLEELTVRKCQFKWPYDLEEWRNKYVEWVTKIQKNGNSFPDLKSIEFRVKDPHDVLYLWKLICQFSTRLERVSYGCKTPASGLRLNSGVEEFDDMYETVAELFEVMVELINKFANKLEKFHSYLIDSRRKRFCENKNFYRKYVIHQRKRQQRNTMMNRFCSDVLAKLNWEILNLNSFCLYGGEISKDNVPVQVKILKDFIKTQHNLQKVILPRIQFNNPREFEELLKCIPKTSLAVIRAPTMDKMPLCVSTAFPQLNEYYIEAHGTPDLQTILPPGTLLPNVKTFSYYNCSDWVWQTVKIMAIVNAFPNLTELLIRDDGPHQCTRLGDSDIQNICRHYPLLRKLHLTNVDCATDFGFTGILEKECRLMNESGSFVPGPGTKTGYSISSLKRLEYLYLSDIGFRVTNVSFIFGFVFENLRFLMLEGYPKVFPWAVEKLKKNNTKLKRWALEFHDIVVSQLYDRQESTPIES